ncbi:MAG: hypothetical protein HOP19_11630 [Acidobacteria bacterium]|nr:hypothetical protein [Acidobacteriota bacterium]
MNTQEAVRDYLSERGCAMAVIEGGVPGLLEQWEALIAAVEEGYGLGLDDYLNELDVRQLLADVIANVPKAETQAFTDQLQRADEQFQALTHPTEACLWGEEVAAEEGWSSQNNFWYYRRPRNGDPDFLAEINEALADYE